jgi:hypothetical protein
MRAAHDAARLAINEAKMRQVPQERFEFLGTFGRY